VPEYIEQAIAIGQIRAHQDPDKQGVRVRVESGPEVKTNRLGQQVEGWRVRVVHPYQGNQTSSIRADRLVRFPVVG
jgi:hypothetical protein